MVHWHLEGAERVILARRCLVELRTRRAHCFRRKRALAPCRLILLAGLNLSLLLLLLLSSHIGLLKCLVCAPPIQRVNRLMGHGLRLGCLEDLCPGSRDVHVYGHPSRVHIHPPKGPRPGDWRRRGRAHWVAKDIIRTSCHKCCVELRMLCRGRIREVWLHKVLVLHNVGLNLGRDLASTPGGWGRGGSLSLRCVPAGSFRQAARAVLLGRPLALLLRGCWRGTGNGRGAVGEC